jgi:hypothetical protein
VANTRTWLTLVVLEANMKTRFGRSNPSIRNAIAQPALADPKRGRSSTTVFLLILASFLGFNCPASAQDDSRAAVAWFHTLGYPDLSKAKLVKVATGGSWTDSAGQHKSFRTAFLIKTEGDSFTVFNLDLKTESFKKSPKNTPENQRVNFEECDLKKSVDAYLKSLSKSDNTDDRGQFLGESLRGGAELFLVGYVCARQGHIDQALKMMQQTRKRYAEGIAPGNAKSLRQYLIDEIADSLLHDAVASFTQPWFATGAELSRKELLAKFERIAKHFPEGENAEMPEDVSRFDWKRGHHTHMVKYYLDRLKKMVEEDEAHAKLPLKPDKDLTKKERIAELIFRLRDQYGIQWSHPGSCDIFDRFLESKDAPKTPAHQLVKMGYDAVPQLIDALDDERFCRAVQWNHFSARVLRVGDCASMIIGRIAGRSFPDSLHASNSYERNKEVVEMKEKIQSWWKEFQKKGERQMLIEATRSGDWNSIESGRMLQERYPDSALDALNKGIAAAREDWVKTSLTRTIAKLKGNEALKVLRELLKTGSLVARVAAANELLGKGIDDGIEPLIGEWHRSLTITSRDEGTDELTRFLAHCDRPEAIKALGKDLHKRPIGVRREVVSEVVSAAGLKEKPAPLAVVAARDELLVRALADEEQCWGLSMSWSGGASAHDPRLCDLVARELSELWKQPAGFDISAPVRVRDRQRVELQNTWRKKQGLPPLPMPTVKTIKRMPDKDVMPKLLALLSSADDAEREKAQRAIELLGLPALPAAKEMLTKTKDEPAFSNLQETVNRLASIVDEIRFGQDSAEPSKELRRKINAFKGKPLDTDALGNLTVAFSKSMPQGTSGIEVTIAREGDDTGLTLGVTIVKGKVPPIGAQLGWSHNESISVDSRGVHGVMGTCIYAAGITDGCWGDYTGSLQKALDSGPNKRVLARLRVDLTTW